MPDNIPNFPEFRNYTIEDTEWFYDFYLHNKLNPYVDMNPQNMYVWLNMKKDLSISLIDGALVIKYTNVLNSEKLNIIPLENPIRNSTIDLIFDYLKKNDNNGTVCEVPSFLCDEIDTDKYSVEDDFDSYEYILDTTKQYKLEGSDFSRQRRRIGFFEREHELDDIDINFLEEIDDTTRGLFIHHVMKMPLNSKEEAAQDNIFEPIAIMRNLENSDKFHKKALIIKINEKVASIVMISYLDDKTASINHVKVDYSVQYIFQYTIYQLAKILSEKGILEMNLEQDLGLSGLRTFKQRLQPSRMLEKKVISLRHQ